MVEVGNSSGRSLVCNIETKINMSVKTAIHLYLIQFEKIEDVCLQSGVNPLLQGDWKCLGFQHKLKISDSLVKNE